MQFRISGYFQAETIDDAFRQLASYFAALSAGGDPGESCGSPREIRVERDDATHRSLLIEIRDSFWHYRDSEMPALDRAELEDLDDRLRTLIGESSPNESGVTE